MITVYDTWQIDSISIPHVRRVENNTREGVITLECSAVKENIAPGDDDPRDEIDRFQVLTSQYVSNTPLLNGGSKLQASGDYVVVTDGVDTWNKCAVSRVTITEDSVADKRIDYTITINYEMEGNKGSEVYSAENGFSGEYTNIVCYRDSTKAGSPCTDCTDFGWLEITETKNVRRVEVYGTAYHSYSANLAWIECNSQREYWTYNSEGDLKVGFEKIVFDLDTPSMTVTLQTSNHVSPYTTTDGLGAWVQWIKVYYE